MSLNRCEFIGNLGRDPEIRNTQGGDKVANLSIGVTEKWKNKNTGERQEKTEWVRATLFGSIAGIAEQYLSKGSKVYIAGKMQTRSWEDQSGQTKYSTEIILSGFDSKLVMLDSKQGGNTEREADQASQGGGGYTSGGMEDDGIPFAPMRELP